MRRLLRLTPRTVNPPEPAGGYPVALLLIPTFALSGLAFWAIQTGHSLSPGVWYVSRAAGLALYLLLWLTVVLGMGIITGVFGRLGGRAYILSLHAFATRLAYGFLALHMLSLLADQTMPFSLRQMLIPFTSSWHEPWTGFGVISAWLLVIVGGSFSVRRFIGFRGWRALHALALPLYVIATLHGIRSGSDASTPWVQVMYVVTADAVLFLALLRLMQGNSRRRDLRSERNSPIDRLQEYSSNADAGRAHAHIDY
jgi:sulfoxide reductase heme-binding subunit YedZ